jgi:hypothetical protein
MAIRGSAHPTWLHLFNRRCWDNMWLSDRLQSLSDGIRRRTPGTAIMEKEIPPSPPPPIYPHEATIYVQKRLESAHALTVDLNISLEEFKGITEKVLGVPAVDQRIYQRGVLFPACCGGCRGYKDNQSLGHYDVRDVCDFCYCLSVPSGSLFRNCR